MESKPFQILQLNAQKKRGVMHSVINDEILEDFGALLISEPHVWRNNEGKTISTPIAHRNWSKTEPTVCNNEGRWPYRSIIWTRSDLEVEQIRIESFDVMAVVMQLPQGAILLISVNVQGSDPEALRVAILNINQAIIDVKQRINNLEVIVAGDLNRHGSLWGGEIVLDERQGEAEPIIELMRDQDLTSLLKRGIITRYQGGIGSTTSVMQ